MNSLSRIAVPLALLLAGFLAPPAAADGWNLFQAMRQRGELELVVEEGPLAERCRAAARLLEARTGLQVAFLAPGDPTDVTRPRIVVGDWDTPGVKLLAEALEVERRKGPGFRYDGRDYVKSSSGLMAWFEDPERPGLPVALYLCEEEESLARLVTDLMPAAAPSIRCTQGGDIRLEALLTPKGGLIHSKLFTSWAIWKQFREAAAGGWGPNIYNWIPADVDAERQKDYENRLVEARNKVVAWLDLGKSKRSLRIVYYSQLEDLKLLARDSELSVANLEFPGAHVLLAPGVPDDGGSTALCSMVTKALGPPPMTWLGDGLSVAATGEWWGRPLEQQLGRLASAGIALRPSQLIDPASDEIYSPHLLAPLRALLFELAIESAEPARVVDLWTGQEPLVIDDELIRAFDARLAASASEFGKPESSFDATRFRAGIALEAERDSGEPNGLATRGYGTRSSDRVLERVSGLGANAVVLSTNAFMDREWPLFLDPPQALRREATVSDAALASAASKAHSLSMEVLLQPQLLTSASGIPVGQKAWSGTESTDRMLASYERFIEHYALLSDLLGIEMLCFGTELVSAMKFVPDPRRRNVDFDLLNQKRESWLAMIQRVRAIYDGGLTYAMRSSYKGSVLKSFQLWKHFDFISASLFEVVDPERRRRPDDSGRIEEQLVGMSKAAERLGRPLMILPIGYPSSPEAARAPGRLDRRTQGVQLERQTALYRALAEVMNGVRERGELAGFFLWNFSTDEHRSGPSDFGYSPLGKPAEAWLPLLFGR